MLQIIHLTIIDIFTNGEKVKSSILTNMYLHVV
uniref:Uncharacterized protein n=1 Tax=Anguilla anguilla TaxID=7936 RepID=A0A0E9XSP4_ANGAN